MVILLFPRIVGKSCWNMMYASKWMNTSLLSTPVLRGRIEFKLDILSLVFSKMVKLTKYAIILICRARTNGTSIKELCNIYGHERKTILRILHQHLVLPIDNGLLPTSDDKKHILKNMDRLRSNPYLTLDQLNMRFPKVFNECCLNRMRKHTKDFLKSLSKDKQ